MRKLSLKRIALALVLILVPAVTVLLAVRWYRLRQLNLYMRSPEVHSIALVSAVLAWQADRQGCPTVQQLESERFLDQGFVTDQWGSSYMIECGGELIKIHSLGPDRRLNTPDDVIVSKPNR